MPLSANFPAKRPSAPGTFGSWTWSTDFSYQMVFETQSTPMDKVMEFDGLKVFVDQTSLMYLDGTRVDYVEALEGAGFKFDNPNVKTTCGCGSSFSV